MALLAREKSEEHSRTYQVKVLSDTNNSSTMNFYIQLLNNFYHKFRKMQVIIKCNNTNDSIPHMCFKQHSLSGLAMVRADFGKVQSSGVGQTMPEQSVEKQR